MRSAQTNASDIRTESPLPKQQQRRTRHAGLLGAGLGMTLSLFPSLLPREPLMQGVLSAILVAVGFGFAAALWRLLTRRGVLTTTAVRRLADAVVVGVLLVAAVRYLPWQNELRAAMGMPAAAWSAWPAILLFTGAALSLCWSLTRAVRPLRHRVTRRLGPVAGAATAVLLAAALVAVGIGALSSVTTSISTARDAGTTNGTQQPQSSLRSGSPQSLVPWQSLGRKGRDFVAFGPSAEEIAAFTGTAAREPIRVYVGSASAPTPQQRAALAVGELQRTGAFDRSVLVLAMPTGTGMVEPFAADSLEYLHSGDTAIVAVQYSARPSWLSVLMDRRAAQSTATAVFDAVYTAWQARPAAQRPALYLYGHSLGAEAFGPVVDRLAAAPQGVGGTVGESGVPVDQVGLGDHDDPGDPSVRGGPRVPGDPSGGPIDPGGPRDPGGPSGPSGPSGPINGALLAGPPVAWRSAAHPAWVRVMRHPSDPVALFSPTLAVFRPAWLGPQRPEDLARAMRWVPFVTFLQVAADLPQAVFVPWGNGHMYSEVEYGSAWAALTGLGELAPSQQQRLLEQMRQDSSPVVGLLD